MSRYPLVPLGEVMALARDEVAVEPDQTYRIAGIYSFGKGLFARPTIEGTETKYRSLYRLHERQFVLSRLKGWEGAVAVVGADFDGAFVSQEFPTFDIDPTVARPDYLDWICRWQPFWESLQDRSKGVGARRERVHPDRLLATKVPLPPLSRQSSVVRHLMHLASRVTSARSQVALGTQAASALTDSVLYSQFNRLDAGAPRPSSIGEFAAVIRGRGPEYQPGSVFRAVNQACVRWSGIDLAQTREISESSWRAAPDATRIRETDVLVNSTGEGTIGRACVAGSVAKGLPFDSHVLSVRIHDNAVVPEYLEAWLRSPQGQGAIELAKGANTTKQTELGKRKLELLELPLPPKATQREIVAYAGGVGGKARELDALLRKVDVKLDALLRATLNTTITGSAQNP